MEQKDSNILNLLQASREALKILAISKKIPRWWKHLGVAVPTRVAARRGAYNK